MIARTLALAIVVNWSLQAQPAVSEGTLLLSRVKRVMEAHLSGVPNYTCQQSVERYQQKGNDARASLVDVLRLDVAFVGGRELFAWPGSLRFEEQEVNEVVRNGAFGTGDFTLHARGVFLSDGTQFDYLGEEPLEGRPARKFAYQKPLFRSGYQIANHRMGRRADVAYRGFFWVHPDTLDLMRLSVEALDIPLQLQVTAATSVLDYAMLPLGGRQALLPQRSELRLTDSYNVTSINKMRLTRCKLFQGESSIRFDDPTEAGAAQAAQESFQLPAGLEMELALQSEVVHGVSAVGDPIEAVLKTDLRDGKKILLSKGAIAKGRITELSRHAEFDCFTVSFQMDEIRAGNRVAQLRLRLLRTEPAAQPRDLRVAGQPGAGHFEYPLPSRGGFTWFRNPLRLGRGFVTIWETQSIAP